MIRQLLILLCLTSIFSCASENVDADLKAEKNRLYKSAVPYLVVKQDSALLFLDSLEILLNKEYDDEFYTKNLIFRANIAFELRQFQKSDSIHQELESQFTKYNNPELEAYTYLARANQFEQQDRHLDASQKYERVLSLVDTTFRNYEIFHAVTLQNAGLCYKNLYELDKAFNYLMKADSLYEVVGTNKQRWNVYNNLGIMYRVNRQYRKAKKYHSKAMEIAHFGKTKNKNRSLYNLALIYQNEGNCDSTLILLDSILSNPHLSKHSNLLSANLLSLRCNLDKGNLGKANYHLKEYQSLIKSKQISPMQDRSDYANALINLHRGENNLAIPQMKRSIDTLLKYEPTNLERLTFYYQLLSNAYSGTSNVELAEAYLDSTVQVQEKFWVLQNEDNLAMWEKRYALAEKNREIESQQQDLVYQSSRIKNRNILIFLLIGMLGLIVFLLRSYRKNNQLLRINNQIIQEEGEKFKAENELLQRKLEELKNKLDTDDSILDEFLVLPGGKDKVRLKDIIYVKSIDNGMQFITTAGNYFKWGSLTNLLTLLPSTYFKRSSRSFIVNTAHIKAVNTKTLTMSNGDTVKITDKSRLDQ